MRLPAPIALFALLLTGALPAAAADPVPDPPLSLCDPDVAERLEFLEDRLAMHARYANRWLLTWNAVYGGGLLVEGVQAGLEDASGERANHVVNAAKAVVGLGRNFWRPPRVKDAPRDLSAIPIASPGDCERRLSLAEDILRRGAKQAHDERKSWKPHAGNIALNLIGALIVAEGFDEGTGWSSAAIGFTIGEVRIWTYPWHSAGTLDEYGRRFPAPVTSRGPGWYLAPFHTGARVTFVW